MDLRTGFKNSLVAGVLLVAPLAVTAFVVVTVFGWLTGVVDPIVTGTRLTRYTGDRLLARVVAALLLLGLVVLLGFIAELSIGQRAFGGFDRLVGVLPLVSVVYTSVRQVANAMVSGESRYDRVVFVEYPRRGLYSVGFVTAEGPADADEVIGEPSVNVFLPNSPNPTAGRLVVVPESDVHETEMTIRQGIRLVVTTGMAESHDEMEALRREELAGAAGPGEPAPGEDAGGTDAAAGEDGGDAKA